MSEKVGILPLVSMDNIQADDHVILIVPICGNEVCLMERLFNNGDVLSLDG